MQGYQCLNEICICVYGPNDHFDYFFPDIEAWVKLLKKSVWNVNRWNVLNEKYSKWNVNPARSIQFHKRTYIQSVSVCVKQCFEWIAFIMYTYTPLWMWHKKDTFVRLERDNQFHRTIWTICLQWAHTLKRMNTWTITQNQWYIKHHYISIYKLYDIQTYANCKHMHTSDRCIWYIRCISVAPIYSTCSLFNSSEKENGWRRANSVQHRSSCIGNTKRRYFSTRNCFPRYIFTF